MKLKPVTYTWKNARADQGNEIGFLAQDLLETVPEAVVTKELVMDKDGNEQVVPVKKPRSKIPYSDTCAYSGYTGTTSRAIRSRQKDRNIGSQDLAPGKIDS